MAFKDHFSGHASAYARYRPDYAVNEVNPHLHNVPVQIMAERGIPALLIWLAFVMVLSAGLLRLFRRMNSRQLIAHPVSV